jgi:two-component sensor histidine kinase
MREMSHRIKNLFSVADSMVRMTARNAATKEELAETLSGRLHALAQANGLIRRSFGTDVAALRASPISSSGSSDRAKGSPPSCKGRRSR